MYSTDLSFQQAEQDVKRLDEEIAEIERAEKSPEESEAERAEAKAAEDAARAEEEREQREFDAMQQKLEMLKEGKVADLHAETHKPGASQSTEGGQDISIPKVKSSASLDDYGDDAFEDTPPHPSRKMGTEDEHEPSVSLGTSLYDRSGSESKDAKIVLQAAPVSQKTVPAEEYEDEFFDDNSASERHKSKNDDECHGYDDGFEDEKSCGKHVANDDDNAYHDDDFEDD